MLMWVTLSTISVTPQTKVEYKPLPTRSSFTNDFFSVPLEFSTPQSSKDKMIKHGRIFKLKRSGAAEKIVFRIKNFEEIRLTFQGDSGVTGTFPVIEVSPTEFHFGRQTSEGSFKSLASFYKNFDVGSSYDLFLATNGTEVQFGLTKNSFLQVLGNYSYEELDSLPFVGFSSTNDAEWLLEGGERAQKIRINEGNYQTFLEVTCKTNHQTTLAEWTLPTGALSLEDLTRVSCVDTTSCQLGDLSYENSVSLAPYRDTFGNNIQAQLEVSVGDQVTAWCTNKRRSFSPSPWPPH